MENISNYIRPEVKTTSARSQREEILNKFFDRIDKEREGTGWPPVNRRLYAIRLNTAFKNVWALEEFYAECNDAPCGFGRRFFGGFKKQTWKDKQGN